ncbi:MAG: hydrogenase expression/formation protein HypE [Clostridiales Family XIII bacterium]|nr:hydrogenase expression/formation protein HypE [Clostridiales Family XIII bacterium]
MSEYAKNITMAHGSGGRDSAALMRGIFGKHFSNRILDRMEDGAVLPLTVETDPVSMCVGTPPLAVKAALPCGNDDLCTRNGVEADRRGGPKNAQRAPLVVSTDSFVVTPVEFCGGDIGKLAVCGTVNDILMMGATPKYLTCGFILEEGLELAVLDRIVASMAAAAREAGVLIVAGDTKVIEARGTSNADAYAGDSRTGADDARTDAKRGGGHGRFDAGKRGGVMINTAGIGALRKSVSVSNARPGDAVIVSGNLGDHHACILSARMGIENGIQSDCALLSEPVVSLLNDEVDVHVMRDVTRGGLGTVLNEIATASGVTIELAERDIPVDPEVRGFCGIMGLDPIYMGNEGKMVAIVPEEQAERALALIRASEIGRSARIIGAVTGDADAFGAGAQTGAQDMSGQTHAARGQSADRDALFWRNPRDGLVIMRTRIGGLRRIDVLFGEGLPRIC